MRIFFRRTRFHADRLNSTKVKYKATVCVLPVMANWVSAVLFAALLGVTNLEAKPFLRRICASPDGANTLEWVVNKDTCQQLLNIEIYGRQNKFSPFSKISDNESGSASQFSHTGAAAYQKGAYFLKYTIKCGGNAVVVFSDTVDVDSQAPDVIDPDSVSVVNGKVVMGWTASKAPDSKSYVIYRTVGTNNFPVDTVFGKNNTVYNDTGVGHPEAGGERYRIAAVDSCDNISPIGNYHQTMFLKHSSDNCKGLLYLQWSPYIGWDAQRYEVFLKEDGVYRSVDFTTQTADTLKGLKTNTTYSIYVRAFKKGGGATSSSNEIVFTADFGDYMEYLYITSITYLGSDLHVKWIAPANVDLDHFELWRGLDKIHLVKVADLGKTKTDWMEPAQGENVIYYKLRAFNTCGKMLAESNISNSIVLTVSKENNQRVLRWNGYGTWLNGVWEYRVYKAIYGKDTTGLLPLGSTEAKTTFFIDTSSISLDTLPGACYYVQAVENGVNKLGVSGWSQSNSVCYTNPPIVYIPNAFNPHANINTRFRPSVLNVDYANSSMFIYNRFGQRIAENVNLEKGWDAIQSNGTVAAEGVYFYIIQLQGIDGSRELYKGTVTLF